MPKIIPGLDEKIIGTAKNILFTEGYDALSMRRMASECNIAVGTIYNYVKDKNDLVAKICLSDWIKTVQKIIDLNEDEKNFSNGVLTIYRNVKAFDNTYIGYWKNITMRSLSSHESMGKYHPKFITEIQKMIVPLMNISDEDKKENISKMLAELISSLVLHDENYENDLKQFIDTISL